MDGQADLLPAYAESQLAETKYSIISPVSGPLRSTPGLVIVRSHKLEDKPDVLLYANQHEPLPTTPEYGSRPS